MEITHTMLEVEVFIEDGVWFDSLPVGLAARTRQYTQRGGGQVFVALMWCMQCCIEV
jgi:hypothetical protein